MKIKNTVQFTRYKYERRKYCCCESLRKSKAKKIRVPGYTPSALSTLVSFLVCPLKRPFGLISVRLAVCYQSVRVLWVLVLASIGCGYATSLNISCEGYETSVSTCSTLSEKAYIKDFYRDLTTVLRRLPMSSVKAQF